MQPLKRFLALLLTILLFVSCSQNTVYSFESAVWGESPEQVTAALDLSLEDAVKVSGTTDPNQKDVKDYTGYVFENYDQNGFTGKLTLVFRKDKLERVQLIADDPNVLGQKMTELYGTFTDGKSGSERNGISFYDGTAEWWNQT